MIAVQDVEKEISFCKTVGVPIAGIIENMSGYVCPHCTTCSNVFSSGGGDLLAKEHQLRFLGKLPICPKVARLLEGNRSENVDGQICSLIESYRKTELYPLFNLIAEDLTAITNK